MTNLEKYIKETVKKIKKEGSVDKNYHWSEITTLLEEASKYISDEAVISPEYQGLVFIGYTNPFQIVHSCDKVEPSGSFYPNTDENTTIPLFMLRCHENRLLNLTDGDLSIEKIKELQEGGEL